MKLIMNIILLLFLVNLTACNGGKKNPFFVDKVGFAFSLDENGQKIYLEKEESKKEITLPVIDNIDESIVVQFSEEVDLSTVIINTKLPGGINTVLLTYVIGSGENADDSGIQEEIIIEEKLNTEISSTKTLTISVVGGLKSGATYKLRLAGDLYYQNPLDKSVLGTHYLGIIPENYNFRTAESLSPISELDPVEDKPTPDPSEPSPPVDEKPKPTPSEPSPPVDEKPKPTPPPSNPPPAPSCVNKREIVACDSAVTINFSSETNREKICDANGNVSYSFCQVISCINGYIVSGNKCVQEQAPTGSATIVWKRATERVDGSSLDISELKGVRMYYGFSARNYIGFIDILDNTAVKFTLNNWVAGTYYIALTSIDTDNRESSYSSELALDVN